MNYTQQIELLKEAIRIREMSDDGYYISRQYKEDMMRLYKLESANKETKTKEAPHPIKSERK